VAPAAIQGLNQKLQAAEWALARMQAMHAAQAARLSELEAKLGEARAADPRQAGPGPSTPY
jgi:hypothetical protein